MTRDIRASVKAALADLIEAHEDCELPNDLGLSRGCSLRGDLAELLDDINREEES